MPLCRQARLTGDDPDRLAWRGAGQPVCVENGFALHRCAATDTAGKNLSPVGNHKLTSISSDELASGVIMQWSVIRANHQKQPIDDSEYVSGLNIADAVADVCLYLYAPAAVAKQETALDVPTGPGKKLT